MTKTHGYTITEGSNEALILDTIPLNINGTEELKRLAVTLGNHWFDKDTLRFFSSRFGATIYGKRYFVSSERYQDDPRVYSIREFSFYTATREDGREIVYLDISTVGEMGEYGNSTSAVVVIRKLLSGELTPSVSVMG